MRKIDVAERRARLASRHRLLAAKRADAVVEETKRVVCLRGTMSIFPVAIGTGKRTGVTINTYARAGDVNLGSFEFDAPTQAEIERRKRFAAALPRAREGNRLDGLLIDEFRSCDRSSVMCTQQEGGRT